MSKPEFSDTSGILVFFERVTRQDWLQDRVGRVEWGIGVGELYTGETVPNDAAGF